MANIPGIFGGAGGISSKSGAATGDVNNSFGGFGDFNKDTGLPSWVVAAVAVAAVVLRMKGGSSWAF